MQKELIDFKMQLGEAIEVTTAWRTAHDIDPKIPMAFTIRALELRRLLKEIPPDTPDLAFRFYLGYKQVETDSLTPPLSLHIPCLVMVAVYGFETGPNGTVPNKGNDLYELKDAPEKMKPISGCFDFTYPCPTTCQIDSPLMTGKIPPSSAQ